MSMFPTSVALSIARKAEIHKLCIHDINLHEAMKDFQKVSVVSSFEDSIVMIEAHLHKGELNEEQIAALQRIYDFTSIEVDGIIIDKVGAIAVDDAKGSSSNLEAAKLMNQIRNGDEDVKGNVKKIVFELQKD